jgi:hypothetical protein
MRRFSYTVAPQKEVGRRWNAERRLRYVRTWLRTWLSREDVYRTDGMVLVHLDELRAAQRGAQPPKKEANR